MVEVRGMQKVLFVLGAIFQVAEVHVSQREIRVAISAKPRLTLYNRDENKRKRGRFVSAST